jgi:hypothetical protein
MVTKVVSTECGGNEEEEWQHTCNEVVRLGRQRGEEVEGALRPSND